MFTIYIHIPYCLVKCGYCDFHSLPTERSEVPHRDYAQAVIDQLHDVIRRHDLVGREVGAIFFGGGTPSLMEPFFFQRVLRELKDTFSFAPDIEITSEMNPATAKFDWLASVREIGVNRLSVGIQSFQPKLLKFLDRDHTADNVHCVLGDARRAGFENLSCDLIYALPGETLQHVASDLQTACSFAPVHISAYQLTFEPGTPLFKRYHAGTPSSLPAKISDDEAIAHMALVTQYLEKAGLLRYEISNYSQPGYTSQHNLNYWRYGEYLGLGSGAVSFLQQDMTMPDHTESFGQRWTTTRNVHRYLQGDFETKDIDSISRKTAMGECCFLGLRMMEGVSFAAFEMLFECSLCNVYAEALEKLTVLGLVDIHPQRMCLSERGILLSNEVFRHFV